MPALREGFVTNVLNPKVALFYVAFLPQFIRPIDQVFEKTFLLVGIHYAMCLIWLTTVTLAGHRATKMLSSRKFRQWLDIAADALFVGLGTRVALSRH